MSVIVTTPINGRTRRPERALVPRSEREAQPAPSGVGAPEQRILAVEFRSPDGRSWHAIGGGPGGDRLGTGKLLRR
jgi:hypothetical protein